MQPIPFRVAKELIVRHHYLHSLPGGTQLAFGVFLGKRLLGALTLGVGPANAHRLVEGARPADCLTLTRLWLSDELPRNSESRAMGYVLRALKANTDTKFLLTYADPSAGHLGVIYQASNWLYIGLSEAMPLYDLGDGSRRHSRSLSHAYGTHSVRHFAHAGVRVRLVPQAPKPPSTGISTSSIVPGGRACWRRRCHIPSGRPAVRVVDLPLEQLQEAPWNPNRLDEGGAARLRESLSRFGLVQALVVRRLGNGYEVLSGNQRLRALRESGAASAPCVVVELDDAEARLLAQALNHIHGEDDLGLRGELLRAVLAALPAADVVAVLPETADSLRALASLGQEDLAAHLQAWQQAQAARLNHLQFQLTPEQLTVVEQALRRARTLAKQMQGDSPNVRGTALFVICKSFLDGEVAP